MELPMEAMAAAIGVSVPVLRFLLCFVATIPVSFLWRFVPSATGKHLYAGVSGALLSYLSFGLSSNLHFLIPMTLGYLLMLLSRPHCGILTFFAGFGYLIACHVYYMSGDAWKEGGIDSTGALMVLTLKVISCAINYNDGLIKEEENMREAQKKYRLIKCPSIIEYFGYCLCCGTHFAGPVYEMKDYLDWTERKGVWASTKDKPAPSPLLPTLRAIIQAGICMGLYLYLAPQFPLSRFSDPEYQNWSFWHKLFFQYMSGFTARWKYYFIWSISEASVIISGLGFTGWTDSSPPKAKWDRAKNVDVLGVELAGSSVQLPLVWNIQVSTWLRHYVYERLVKKGKKAGFLQLLGTQTVSAIWHGLYPGYIIFFVQSALMIAGSRVIYRWQQAVSSKNAVLAKLLAFANFLYTLLVLNYSCIGFMVLSLEETLGSYRSVYFVGTIVPIVVIFLYTLLVLNYSCIGFMMIDASLFIDPVLGIFYWLLHVVVKLAHAWSYLIFHIKCLIIYSEFLPKYKNLKLDRLQHLAVVIDSEEATNKTNIDLLLFWLAALRVNYVTLYDIEGVLKKSEIGLPKTVVIDSNTKCSDVDVNTSSIFLKFGMTVEVISYTDGKEAAAKAANYLSSKILRNQEETISSSELKFTEDDILSALKAVGHDGPEPDLMLIYGPVRCHFGFPAWRLRYTEIVHMGPLSSLKYSGIVKAFYDFSKKHQNYGK